MTYRLAVGAMFKNERPALVEWIEHYLFHGAEHFYLIDDGSTDGGIDVLVPYVNRGVMHLWRDEPQRVQGRQRAMYDKYILPLLSQTEWLLICDLDEFVWSPHAVDLNYELGKCRGPALLFSHTIFGSNGHVAFPKGGIVASYTRREPTCPSGVIHHTKYFVRSGAGCVGLFVHWPILYGAKPTDAQASFVLNHYTQCLERWQTINMTRGVGEPRWPGDVGARDMAEFTWRDRNDVEDVRLRDQNMPLIERLYGEQAAQIA